MESKKLTMKEKFELEENEIGLYAYDNFLEYKLIGNKLIVVTDIGYWRIEYLQGWDCFVLYHGNSIPNDVNPEKYVDADYHFQKSARQHKKILTCLMYIKDHEDYRCHVIEDVEDMPRRTKKQKKIYNKVKQKEHEYKTALALQMISAYALALAS